MAGSTGFGWTHPASPGSATDVSTEVFPPQISSRTCDTTRRNSRQPSTPPSRCRSRFSSCDLRLAPRRFAVRSTPSFGGGPEGSSKQRQVLDQELAGVAQDLYAMAELQRARRREQTARRQEKRRDRAETS